MKDDFVLQPESFAKKLIEALKSKFKRELKFDYQTVIKTNDCCKPAIVVKEPNSKVGKTIYIENFYDKYKNGVEIEELANSLISICDMKSEIEDIVTDTDELFQKMKDFKYLLNGNIMFNEYSCAAEPPVRCGESHHSGLGEPPFVTYLACLGSNPYTSRMDLSFEGSMHLMFIL